MIHGSTSSVVDDAEVIPAGESVRIGFYGSYRHANSVPGAFTLNDMTCTVE
ncbi:hypothetical protein [Lentzea indica]|uniref:hypothetical protein n=1 Tax=Lentzea indica TaxID=2604800 RepID=UPI00143BFBF7|nr:hypothetical protein [Lentzea indica]